MSIQKNEVSTEPKIPSGGLALLIRVKQAILDDNVLSSKITACGSLAAAHYIDELIVNASRVETLYHDYKLNYKGQKALVEEYYDLLHRSPDELTDEQKAELAALVTKWDKEEGADDGDR